MNIIFLDFDGVLDNATYDEKLINEGKSSCDKCGRPIFDPKCVSNLEKIVHATDAKIIVTSSWREVDSIEELREMWFEREMPGELLDITPLFSPQRGDEIDRWLDMYRDKHFNYIIIDDLPTDCFNAHQFNRLLTVDPMNGISGKDVLRAIELFNRFKQNGS